MQIVLVPLSRATLCATLPAITPVSVTLYLLLQPFFSLYLERVSPLVQTRTSVAWFTSRENKRSHLILWTEGQRRSGKGNVRLYELDKGDDHSKSLDFRMLGSRTRHLSDWKGPVPLPDCHSRFFSLFLIIVLLFFLKRICHKFLLHM